MTWPEPLTATGRPWKIQSAVSSWWMPISPTRPRESRESSRQFSSRSRAGVADARRQLCLRCHCARAEEPRPIAPLRMNWNTSRC
jgi:hypothetical protein